MDHGRQVQELVVLKAATLMLGNLRSDPTVALVRLTRLTHRRAVGRTATLSSAMRKERSRGKGGGEGGREREAAAAQQGALRPLVGCGKPVWKAQRGFGLEVRWLERLTCDV